MSHDTVELSAGDLAALRLLLGHAAQVITGDLVLPADTRAGLADELARTADKLHTPESRARLEVARARLDAARRALLEDDPAIDAAVELEDEG